ncbi:indolepyruvate ferredoxin oxidoreductase family protein [Leeia sp. TBRC 13508]|uniref:Indolepyruvate ferredoxin oxidoreductase family protein n=1 Tax=Leeia speluncae TaxID=2884804 RepID=A0ABS8D901_9NEIS|nr:indolepyruvate ferredoxin oxidoreductase family protein [Leeia speluncae]MCB6184660.1 indolepyruvate ferredoxin oxidoreductase family protein [Leeia speluncae]
MNKQISLTDKYTQATGRVYMSGTQALVRLLLAQKARDEAEGLHTAGFVSGYRGSPLGGLDQALWGAKAILDRHQIRFTPGLNEELAATAIWGTQQVSMDPNVSVDGVFSLWYGKGPGVDRCGDVFKHGNIAGTSAHGGVLLVAGDDHACKSSSLPHQSEHAFIAAMIPVMNPSSVTEFIEFGLHGWAMSRYSGCWVGFKTISDTVESSSSFEIDPLSVDIKIPDTYPVPQDGFSIRWPDPPLEQENRLQRERLYALLEYVRLNNLNRLVIDSPTPKLGIVTTGKSYQDVLEALALLDLDEEAASKMGIRLLKIGVSWPLEPECIQTFAEGLEEILVVEEKRQILEYQIKEHLYNAPNRPRVVGKYDETGEWVKVPKSGILLSPNGELTPTTIACVIGNRLAKVCGDERFMSLVSAHHIVCTASEGFVRPDKSLAQRVPYFCSGCPHNTSTQVPEGSRALAGIGCHYMAMWMNRRTETFSQMGGEGVAWIGQAPFTKTKHVFVNLGDGTLMHSGSLALRYAIATGVNVTYKILVNDAVAMTGGQPVEGAPSVQQIARMVHAEGVDRICLVSDDPFHFETEGGLPDCVSVHHRDDMMAIQEQLREEKGVSVILYAQTCAAEKRRRRKRQVLVDPPRRVMINPHVCEGCGDCGKQSNCVSILPLETPLGRKRTIDQSACNKDFSCLRGFCPSFVTIEGGQLKKAQPKALAPVGNLPEPTLPVLGKHAYNILITGVGGTGVVTIGALLGMAAHIEGKGVLVLDMAGLAQKGGSVTSHVKIGLTPANLHSARIAGGDTDVLLGGDLVVSASKDVMNMLTPERSRSLINTHISPTGAFTQNRDWDAQPANLLDRVEHGSLQVATVNATQLATALFGDALATNMFVLGYAWQQGWIPLSVASIEAAIRLNEVSVEMNLAAFAWGRKAVVDLTAVKLAAGMPDVAMVHWLKRTTKTIDELVTDRVKRLTDYQDADYAEAFQVLVRHALTKGGQRLAETVANQLFSLMAYKDEYEVARLYTDTDFIAQVKASFEGDFQLKFHLAPPLMAKHNAKGVPVKSVYGQWLLKGFKALAWMRRFRGTWLDVFGRTKERKAERQLRDDYMSDVESVMKYLPQVDVEKVIHFLEWPSQVKGFGHVKAAAMVLAYQHRQVRLSALVAASKASIDQHQPQTIATATTNR